LFLGETSLLTWFNMEKDWCYRKVHTMTT
jgi:hypothetical protein